MLCTEEMPRTPPRPAHGSADPSEWHAFNIKSMMLDLCNSVVHGTFVKKRKRDCDESEAPIAKQVLRRSVTPSPRKACRTSAAATPPPLLLEASADAADSVCDPETRFSPLAKTLDALLAQRGIYRRASFADLLIMCKTKTLGAGTYSVVFALQHSSGEWLAVKPVASHDALSMEEFCDDAGDRRLLAMESHVSACITHHLLCFDAPSAARCPNFVAALAFDLSNAVLGQTESGVSRKMRSPTMHITMYGELCELGAVEKREKPRQVSLLAKSTLDILASRERCFSLIAQTLLAIAAMARCGISHNDLNLSNVMERETPADAVLCYRFPQDFQRRPMGNVSYNSVEGAMEFYDDTLCLRTHGSLFCIGDFGLASCQSWLEQDPRLAGFEISRANLGDYYYGHLPTPAIRELVPKDMLLVSCDEKVSWQHPLLFKALLPFERDVSSALSHIVSLLHEAHGRREFSRTSDKFAMAVLRELAQQRPDNGTKMMAFVHSVLRPSFVSRFYSDDVVQRLYETNRYRTRDLHRYALPTQKQGDQAEASLRCRLGDLVPVYHSWTPME